MAYCSDLSGSVCAICHLRVLCHLLEQIASRCACHLGFVYIFQKTRLHQSTSSTKFTIDGHSGVLRIRPGESLDYELSRTHFVTVLAKVTQIPLFSEIDQLLCVDLSSRLLSCISEVQRTSQYQIISAVCLFQDGGGKYQGKYQVMTSTAIITINVLDTQDSPPVFVGTPYFGFVYEVSVPVSVTLFYI